MATKQNYTREEVIDLIDNLLGHGDVVHDAITSENPTHTAEELLELAEHVHQGESKRGVAKTLHNTTASQAKDNVKDIIFWGNGDTFKLISKASSKNEGWMKSSKAMEIPGVGCVVQVTTQQGTNVAEAVTFVPNVKIKENKSESGEVVSRELVAE